MLNRITDKEEVKDIMSLASLFTTMVNSCSIEVLYIMLFKRL